MSDYGVSRIVVRGAVDVLAREGLVVKQQGRGTFVRQIRPQRKRILGHLYGERPTGSPFAASARASGQTPEWEYQSRKATSPRGVAERLHIEPGAPVMRTQYRFLADDEPVMLSTSYEPLSITAGTAVEHPEAGPLAGVVARMDAIGQHVTHVVEDVTAHAPRPYETEALGIPAGVPVLAIERTYFADEIPVETADIVVPADRYTLTYRVTIPPTLTCVTPIDRTGTAPTGQPAARQRPVQGRDDATAALCTWHRDPA